MSWQTINLQYSQINKLQNGEQHFIKQISMHCKEDPTGVPKFTIPVMQISDEKYFLTLCWPKLYNFITLLSFIYYLYTLNFIY
jgi:hypothetical protein